MEQKRSMKKSSCVLLFWNAEGGGDEGCFFINQGWFVFFCFHLIDTFETTPRPYIPRFRLLLGSVSFLAFLFLPSTFVISTLLVFVCFSKSPPLSTSLTLLSLPLALVFVVFCCFLLFFFAQLYFCTVWSVF